MDKNSYEKKLVLQILVGRMLVLFLRKKSKHYLKKKKSIRCSSVMKYCSPPKTIMNIHLAESHILSKLIKRLTLFVLHPRISIRFTMMMANSS